jgi:hypothetical protein
MASGSIQVPLGSPSGSISSFVHDNDQNPTTVLEATKPFQMHVTFSIDPVLAAILGPGPNLRVEVYADQLGGGLDALVGSTNVNHNPVQTNYTTHVACGPLGINSPGTGQSNLYKLAVVLTYANGGPEYITGFTEEILVRTL